MWCEWGQEIGPTTQRIHQTYPTISIINKHHGRPEFGCSMASQPLNSLLAGQLESTTLRKSANRMDRTCGSVLALVLDLSHLGLRPYKEDCHYMQSAQV